MKENTDAQLLWWLACLTLFSYPVFASSADVPPPSSSQTNTVQHASMGNAQAQKVRPIIEAITKKLSSVKQYTAVIDSQSLDPNGGFDKFADELAVHFPDKLRLNRKVLQAHNSDMVGQKITTVVDGTWMFTRTQYGPPGSDDVRPSYVKVNLKSVEAAGGPSVREQLAYMGNIADPFAPYKLDTLKVTEETSQSWILLGEYKEKDAPWHTNRLTIEKATGLLMKLEALIPEMDEPVMLIHVRKVSVGARVRESLFEMEIPAGDAADRAGVSDYTRMWINAVKARQPRQP